MLNTPLTKLRKAAPGSITVQRLERHFRRSGLPRTEAAIGAFERGLVKHPSMAFLAVYAEGVFSSVAAVKHAHRLTLARQALARPRAIKRRARPPKEKPIDCAARCG